MKRVGRIVHRLLTALSLLLLLATAGVWARSYWVSDWLNWDDWRQDRSFFDRKFIWCWRGGIQFEAERYPLENYSPRDHMHFQQGGRPATDYPAWGDEWSLYFPSKPGHYAALGFEWIPKYTMRWNPYGSDDFVLNSLTLPLYFPTLLFALLPAHYFLRLRRRRRIAKRLAQGCCIGCGYDLRASNGRCPECGRSGPPLSAST